MNLIELRETNEVLAELWDFFKSNCDSDETGLVQELEPKYLRVKEAMSKDFYKLHLRNELSKVKRKFKNKK